MPQVFTVRRVFPHPVRRRGLGTIAPQAPNPADSSSIWDFITNPWYNIVEGKLSPSQIAAMQANPNSGTLTQSQIAAIDAQTLANITQAATDPNTGEVNQDLVNQEYQQYLGESASQYTPTADALTQWLGIPITGDGNGSPSTSSFPWGTLLIAVVVVVGGVFVVKELRR